MISHYDKRGLLRFVNSDLVRYYVKVFVTGITGMRGRIFLKEIASAAKSGNTQYEYKFLVRSEERVQLVRGIYPIRESTCCYLA
jgi:hypothetical protein